MNNSIEPKVFLPLKKRKMENRYKIKESCLKYANQNLPNYRYFKMHSNKYYYKTSGDRTIYVDFSDEMFEKVEEERIKLYIQDLKELCKESGENWTENQLNYIEAYLNGELVEKEDEKIPNNFISAESLRSLQYPEEHETKKESSNFSIAKDDNGHLIINGTTYYTKRQMIEIVNEWLSSDKYVNNFGVGFISPDPNKVNSFKEHLNSK